MENDHKKAGSPEGNESTNKSAEDGPAGGAKLIEFISEVPDGAERILDFGCAAGETLMTLKENRGCRELYGVEIKEEHRPQLEERLDGFWITDLGEDDASLGDEYRNFFNYMLLMDVVEHLYDPWYIVPKLSQYLAPDGLMILSVPNLRYWGLWHNIILGAFPYGRAGGLMNEEHIRWFTWESLRELVLMSGLEIVDGRLTFPPDIDVDMMMKRLKSPIAELVLPPPESAVSSAKMVLSFPGLENINPHYAHFLANKVILICKRSGDPVEPVHLKVGELERRMKSIKA